MFWKLNQIFDPNETQSDRQISFWHFLMGKILIQLEKSNDVSKFEFLGRQFRKFNYIFGSDPISVPNSAAPSPWREQLDFSGTLERSIRIKDFRVIHFENQFTIIRSDFDCGFKIQIWLL